MRIILQVAAFVKCVDKIKHCLNRSDGKFEKFKTKVPL